MKRRRRALLKAGFAAGSLLLPTPYAWVWAQSEGALKLLRLAKIALVVGNSKYKEAPLKNPANDARAIGEALGAAGFALTAKLDAGRAEMAAALDAYVKQLAAKKCVGLFYYAGHGVQLQWKNYMLPVDAKFDTVDDVQKQAVDVTGLMGGLSRAANPLNVIILDACRDNPFGTAKPTQVKGLSRMDAPTNTILVYATSPGNVASDGDGANGLYAEKLLREIKIPEAKIEDVFKRVRLGVRRKSNGAQIPWESTSLEEDFWFLPPRELKKLSEEEKEKLFREELAHWEKTSTATEPVRWKSSCGATRTAISPSLPSCNSTACWRNRAKRGFRSSCRRAIRSPKARPRRTPISRWATPTATRCFQRMARRAPAWRSRVGQLQTFLDAIKTHFYALELSVHGRAVGVQPGELMLD